MISARRVRQARGLATSSRPAPPDAVGNALPYQQFVVVGHVGQNPDGDTRASADEFFTTHQLGLWRPALYQTSEATTVSEPAELPWMLLCKTT